MYGYVADCLLYICLAIVVGSTVLNWVPADRKPTIQLSSNLVFSAMAGIPLFSFVSIVKTALFFSDFGGEPFVEVLLDLLQDTEFGKAWIWMLVMSTVALLIMAIRDPQNSRYTNSLVGIILIGIIIAFAWSSHVSGESTTWGFWALTVHILSFSVWIGPLIIISWFFRERTHYNSFLRWYSLLALISVFLIIICGFVMMFYIVPNIKNSWVTDYGQALLIKHILYFILIIFGIVNGFILRKAVNDTSFQVMPWLRAESIIALLILIVTSFMGAQTPPHEFEGISGEIEISPLFSLLHGDKDISEVSWFWSLQGIGSLGLAIASIGAFLYSAKYMKSIRLTVISSVSISIFGYLFIMFSTHT